MMRVRLDYLSAPAGRHRAVRPRYLDIAWTEELTGHRRAVAAIPRPVLDALHAHDDQESRTR